MAAHVTNSLLDGENMMEPHQKISMIVHQVTEEDISVEQDIIVDDLIKENVDDLCAKASETEMEAYEESVIVANSTKGNVAYIEGLYVSTQIDPLDLEENILQA